MTRRERRAYRARQAERRALERRIHRLELDLDDVQSSVNYESNQREDIKLALDDLRSTIEDLQLAVDNI